MTDAELAHTKELAFFMVERVFMNPISAKLLSEDWRKEFPDEVAVAERMKALVEALEKAQQYAKERDAENQDLMLTVGRLRVEREDLESRTVTMKLPPKIERDDSDGWFMYNGGRVGGGAAEWYNKALDDVSSAQSAVVTVKPEDADGVREEGNQFLVVRHPGKVPVIKHPVGQLEDYLLQILKADPLATIDIVTHRYYGVGGQFVEDADEYLHEMGIKWEAE